jgi:hypothetical protein
MGPEYGGVGKGLRGLSSPDPGTDKVAGDKASFIHLLGGLGKGEQRDYRLVPHNGVYGPLDNGTIYPGTGPVMDKHISRIPGGKEGKGLVNRGAARGTAAYKTDRGIRGWGLPGLKKGGRQAGAGIFFRRRRIFGDGNDNKADTRGGGKGQDHRAQNRKILAARTKPPRDQETIFFF